MQRITRKRILGATRRLLEFYDHKNLRELFEEIDHDGIDPSLVFLYIDKWVMESLMDYHIHPALAYLQAMYIEHKDELAKEIGNILVVEESNAK